MKAFNFTRKDEINSVSATPLQNAKGEIVTVIGCAVTEREDAETHEMKTVGLLITKEYGAMSSISKTAIRGIDMLVDYMVDMEADEGVTECAVAIRAGKSNAGREFITIEIQ